MWHTTQSVFAVCHNELWQLLLLKRRHKLYLISVSSWAKIAFHRLNLLMRRVSLGNHMLCMFSTYLPCTQLSLTDCSSLKCYKAKFKIHLIHLGNWTYSAPCFYHYQWATTTREPPGITILYVYCKRATEQLHTHQAGLVVTWLKLTTQLSTVLRGEHWDKHYWY